MSGKQTAHDKSNKVYNGQYDSEDTPMQSSPFMSSLVPLEDNEGDRISDLIITLVGEEDLTGMNLVLSTMQF